MFQDAHNHLQDAWILPHVREIIGLCRQLGVTGLVVNGTCPQDWNTVAELAAAYPEVRPAFGIHPWDARSAKGDWLGELQRQLDRHPTATVGEVGIDRWILEGIRPDDPRIPEGGAPSLAEQEDVFLPQLALARERGVSATIHCLQAWGRLLELLSQTRLPERGFLLHAYSGPTEMVGSFQTLGAYFSFNPSFLAPRRIAKIEPFRAMDPARLLVETDAPAMCPPPEYRAAELPAAPDGTPVSHPASVVHAGTALARILNLDTAALAAQTAANFSCLFGSLPSPAVTPP